MVTERKEFHASSRQEWRKWLEKNHLKENKVYLVRYKKHTGKPTLTPKEAMEEAICFGWIDTTVNRIDDERYAQCFVRRNENSRWSNNTIRYAKRLVKEGKMSPEGIRRYKEGLKKPTIDHGLPKNPKTPDMLAKALAKDIEAKKNFEKLAPSYRRHYIYYIEKAVREETKKKRVEDVVRRARENRKFGE